MINYDFAHQLTLGQNMQRSSRNWSDRARDFYHREKEKTLAEIVALDRRIEASPYFLPGVLAFLVALLLLCADDSMIRYAMARWSLRARRAGNLTASLAALEYTEMLRLLEKRGWKKSPSQTAARIRRGHSRRPICAAPVAQLTEHVPVRTLRQSPRSRRADVLAAPLHPRSPPLPQAIRSREREQRSHIAPLDDRRARIE